MISCRWIVSVMRDVPMKEKGLESKVLFKGVFNNVPYELRPDGLYVDGDEEVRKSTMSAIRQRIMRIYSDGKNKEHKNFDGGLSYADLLKILKE